MKHPTYPVAHDIPIPKKLPGTRTQSLRRENGIQKVYPWASMLPGDSFFVPESELSMHRSSTFHASVSRYRRQQAIPYRIVCWEVEGGMRIWRVG